MKHMQKVLTTYEVNLNTMIILPKFTSHGICSFVKEVDNTFIVLQKPTEIIQHSCIFFGSSYRGRIAGTQALTGFTYKAPIAVSPSNKIFFFPTTSAEHRECIWISHSHVKKAAKAPLNKVTVHFSDYSSVTLNLSIASFENQLYRTAQLKSAYLDRENFQQYPRPFDLVHENEIDEYIQKKKGTDHPQ